MTKAQAMRKLWERVATDKFFEDWWPGMDDAVYEDDHARGAVEMFLAALRNGLDMDKRRK